MGKWTPAQHRKFKATMKARKKERRVSSTKRLGAKAAPPPSVDAIALLKQAERSATKSLRQGDIKQLDKSHLLSMMALRTLEGN